MIKWIKIEAGDYESEDGRFKILKSWDRIYGDHWKLYDKNNPNHYKGTYDESTLMDCKLKASAILSDERKKNDAKGTSKEG